MPTFADPSAGGEMLGLILGYRIEDAPSRIILVLDTVNTITLDPHENIGPYWRHFHCESS